MFTIVAAKEEVLKTYSDIVKKWSDVIINLNKEITDQSEINYFYSYGFFVTKKQDQEDRYDEILNMVFDKRLELELSKIRVSLGMKIGHFFISDRMVSGIIPETIKNVVCEMTKIKMFVESDFHDNQAVKDSIPEFDTSIVSMNTIGDILKEDNQENLDVDLILDKISNSGIGSLSIEEKEFLNKTSKNI